MNDLNRASDYATGLVSAMEQDVDFIVDQFNRLNPNHYVELNNHGNKGWTLTLYGPNDKPLAELYDTLDIDTFWSMADGRAAA